MPPQPPGCQAHANQPQAELVTDSDRAITALWAPLENKSASQAQVIVLIGTEPLTLERLDFYLYVFTVMLYLPKFDRCDCLGFKMVLDYCFSFQTRFLPGTQRWDHDLTVLPAAPQSCRTLYTTDQNFIVTHITIVIHYSRKAFIFRTQ